MIIGLNRLKTANLFFAVTPVVVMYKDVICLIGMNKPVGSRVIMKPLEGVLSVYYWCIGVIAWVEL